MLVHGRGRVGGARSLPRTPADTRGCSLLSCLQSTRELPGSPLALRLESQSSRDPDRAWGPRGSPAAAVGGFPGRPGADLNVPVHLPRVLSPCEACSAAGASEHPCVTSVCASSRLGDWAFGIVVPPMSLSLTLHVTAVPSPLPPCDPTTQGFPAPPRSYCSCTECRSSLVPPIPILVVG